MFSYGGYFLMNDLMFSSQEIISTLRQLLDNNFSRACFLLEVIPSEVLPTYRFGEQRCGITIV